MSYELSVVSFIQYISHYVADLIHNFPDFLSLLKWAGQSFNSVLPLFPADYAHLLFFGASSCFLVRLVKF